jgi:hypothetical protein
MEYRGGCFGLSRNILHLFYIEKQGMAMRFEVGGGSAAALLGYAVDVYFSYSVEQRAGVVTCRDG